jgi:hypothetical protein
MALLDDAFPPNVVTFVALGAAALILPRFVPALAAPMRGVLKTGVSLFLESEFEAEGGLIDGLVGETIDALLGDAATVKEPAERRRKARQALHRFEHRARARAKHWGRDDAGRARRYKRHVAHLKRALAEAERNRPPEQRAVLAEAGADISEDL